jgi:hypothetical protein
MRCPTWATPVHHVGRQTLIDLGRLHPDAITDEMVTQAAVAADALQDRMEEISRGN